MGSLWTLPGAVDAQTRPPRLGQAADGLPTATTGTHLIALGPSGFSVGRGRALHSENRSPS